MCELCLNLFIKTPEQTKRHRFDVFIANFEQVSQIVLVIPLLTLNK